MKWLKKTAVVSCAVGVLASFAAMVPTSHSTEAAIAVFYAKNIEEAIKIAIQTAKILTEEQKQLALQILNTKKPSDNRRREFFRPILSYDVFFNLADKSVVRFAVNYIFRVRIFCYNVCRLKILVHLLEVNLFTEEKFISFFKSDSIVEKFWSDTGRGDFIHISAGLKAEYFMYLVKFFRKI